MTTDYQKPKQQRSASTRLCGRFCLGLCLSLGMAFVLPACRPSSANEQERALKIGVISYRIDDTFIDSLTTTINASIRLREQKLRRKVILNIVGAKSNQDYQNTLIERMIQQKYDVLCINLVDRTMSAPVISKCKYAGIPIVFFNREPVEEDIASWDKLYYVGTSAIDSARQQGQMLLELLQRDFNLVDANRDGKIQYVMLEGEPGHQDTLYRTDYSVAVLSDAGINMDKLASDTANWELSKARFKMAAWLQAFGSSIEVVLANNDDMALGAIQAIEESKLSPVKRPVVLGIDATPVGSAAVGEGRLYGTVVNDAVEQAAVIVDIALALAEGKDPGALSIPYLKGHYARIPHRPLTADNYAEEVKKLQEVR